MGEEMTLVSPESRKPSVKSTWTKPAPRLFGSEGRASAAYISTAC
jgi:hypothetical protein